MQYCYHVWAGASNSFLEMIDKLEKLRCNLNYLNWLLVLFSFIKLGFLVL